MKPQETIENVKIMVEDKLGIPRKTQRLLFNGKHLKKHSTLENNKIFAGCNLN